MGQLTTVGKVLLKANLPSDLRDFVDKTPLDGKGIGKLFTDLATRSTSTYKNAVENLTRLGFEVSTRMGSTVPLNDLMPSIDREKQFTVLDKEVEKIEAGVGTKKEKDAKVLKLYQDLTTHMNKEILDEGLKRNHTLAKIVLSGSRGSPAQYRQTVAAPILVDDAKGNPMIDFSIRKSFAEGLSLPEYLAHSYGTRKGTAATKLCCSGDTEVLMADFSIKKIKDIKTGDFVVGASRDGNCIISSVTNTFSNGLKFCNTYKFRINSTHGFAELTATEDHEVLAKFKLGHGVYKASAIYEPTLLPLKKTRKEIFVAYPAKGFKEFNGVKEDKALFLGLMLGDGCTRGRSDSPAHWAPMMQFSCADLLLLDDIKDYLVSHNYQLHKQQLKGYGYTLNFINKPKKIKLNKKNSIGIPICLSGDPIKSWFRSIGLLNSYAYEKVIPAEVCTWDNASVAALLTGLFSTDGSIYLTKKGKQVGISLTLTSRQLVEEAKKLLQFRFGIYTSVVKITAKAKKQWAKRDQYGFNITHKASVLKFHKFIHLVGIKRLKLNEYILGLGDYHNNREHGFGFVSKTSVGLVATYDIEVDNPDHLFCLPSGMIISNSVADAGFLSKQLSRATLTCRVEEHDCGTINGLVVPVTDKDSIGSFLAQNAGKYNRNQEVTGQMLNALTHEKVDHITVRSPVTCESSKHYHSGSVCQLCVGKRERRTLAQIGEYPALTAATTLGERLAQSSLNTKHQASSSIGKQSIQGFQLINQFLNIPKTFRDKATVAEEDGIISGIRDASQGGKYLSIGKKEYYVLPGMELKVKEGQHVEAGDVLSEGIINPAEIVKHKGIGEGRKYFAETMSTTFKDMGMPITRRNFELIAKSAIDHVRVVDSDGKDGYIPGQITTYNSLAKNYQTRLGSIHTIPEKAQGYYLEEPVLHYTIGTKITQSVITFMKMHHVKEIVVHKDPPMFVPEMQRLLDIPAHEHDWMHQLYSTYLEKRFTNAVNQGATSNLKGPSPIAGLAYGVGFGDEPVKKAVENDPWQEYDMEKTE